MLLKGYAIVCYGKYVYYVNRLTLGSILVLNYCIYMPVSKYQTTQSKHE